jgi:hypothetical protein
LSEKGGENESWKKIRECRNLPFEHGARLFDEVAMAQEIGSYARQPKRREQVNADNSIVRGVRLSTILSQP